MALSTFGKVVYSTTFLIGLPFALWLWARGTSTIVTLPAIHSSATGVVLTTCGLALMLTGMQNLWHFGGGLPINAAPPPRLVLRGAYSLLPHPIYIGFIAVCAGISVWSGSASAFWLITPITALCCAALVVGYEHRDLQHRFGAVEPFLPSDTTASPRASQRLRCFLAAVLPWSAGAFGNLYLSGNRTLVWCAALIVVFLFTVLPFTLRTSSSLRHLMAGGLGTFPGAVALSLASPKPLISLPSPFVICALLFVEAIAGDLPRVLWATRFLAVASAFFAASDGLTTYSSVVKALIAVELGVHISAVWRVLCSWSERVANSWKEWRVGQARLIYHGLFAGAGGALTIWLGAVLAGPGHLTAIIFASSCAVLGAAFWGQFVEGSPNLLRPFGFYGGLLGGILGSLAARLFGTSPFLILAVFAAAGMWAQALGRMRCLVQGCCHGAPTPTTLGIRYNNANSRVCRFTPWTGMYLHPTPLYSIVWNAFCGLLLLQLWILHASLALITGLYFILSGIGRFAEEGWRGEPQTQVIQGLRLYQWASLCSVILGMVFTVVLPRVSAPVPIIRWAALAFALPFGVFVAFTMGVDFPASKRRFSRLV